MSCFQTTLPVEPWEFKFESWWRAGQWGLGVLGLAVFGGIRLWGVGFRASGFSVNSEFWGLRVSGSGPS